MSFRHDDAADIGRRIKERVGDLRRSAGCSLALYALLLLLLLFPRWVNAFHHRFQLRVLQGGQRQERLLFLLEGDLPSYSKSPLQRNGFRRDALHSPSRQLRPLDHCDPKKVVHFDFAKRVCLQFHYEIGIYVCIAIQKILLRATPALKHPHQNGDVNVPQISLI